MKIDVDFKTTIKEINDYHANKKERPRPHMGVSLLGHHCERYLWLNFRWAVIEKFEGRILRLFRRGHMEEKTIVQDLRAVGVDIQHTEGAQSRVDFGCHVSGSIDGIIEQGLIEAPVKRHIAEFKTHGLKSFKDLCKDGVEKSKWTHYIQMQVYMLGSKINDAFYLAVCKDNDELYTERVKLDKKLAQEYVNKGHRLAMSERIPEPCSGASPDWYLCKWCAAYDFCHKEKPTQEVNCRTCANVTPTNAGEWHCYKWQDNVPVDAQYEGCPSHALHPDLVPYKRIESDQDCVAVYEIEGRAVKNGDGHYSSKEIIANPSACGEPFVNAFKSAFPTARVKG